MKTETDTEIKARPTVNYLDGGLAVIKAMAQVGFKAGAQSKKILNAMLDLFDVFHADAGIDEETMVKDESVPVHLNCDVTPYVCGEDGKEKLHHFDMVFSCQNNEDKTDFWVTINGGKKIINTKFTRLLTNGAALDKNNPFETLHEKQFKFKPSNIKETLVEVHKFYEEIRNNIKAEEDKTDDDLLESAL